MSLLHTYVANRESLFADLEHFISSHQVSGKKFAVLLININHFRQINIAYGYQAGDKILEGFVSRLNELCREQDYIARMGNSEFLLVLPEILNEGHATLAAHKISRVINDPFDLGDRQHKVTANIGIALFPTHSNDLTNLIQKAEIALMTARTNLQLFSVYSDQSTHSELRTWNIEVELQNARERDEFDLYFQPQVRLDTGELYGAEALIRWNNQNRGFIRPDIFIPMAEKDGQIQDITWWTFNAALRLIKEWPETKVPLKVSVNLSAKMLGDPDLVDSVRSALNIWDTDHQRLTIEITESALMEDMSTSLITLEELKSLGVNISIDDFGTGYSSMAYFKYIPANELKIDQSFVRYMLENTMDEHIVKTIIEMAHGFEIDVIAEGIENKETYEALKAIGCNIAQGFYLAKPMSQEQFIEWLDNYKPK